MSHLPADTHRRLEGPTATGGSPEHLLQDQSRGLSQWLANQPDARLHAREAAAALADQLPRLTPAGEAAFARQELLAALAGAISTIKTAHDECLDGDHTASRALLRDAIADLEDTLAQAPAQPAAVQPLPARFVLCTLRDLKAERKRLDGFLSLGNEVGRAAVTDEWIAALEAYAAAVGITQEHGNG